MACAVNRGGVFAIIALCVERQVIGGCKVPTPFPWAIFAHEKAKILAVVVFVVGQVVEYHSAKHFFDVFWILRQISGQSKQVAVIENWGAE